MMSAEVLIEVAVETPFDVAAALAGGADRLELCAGLDLGGLTPTPGLVTAAMNLAGSSPVCLMIRPRPGDFVYTESEIAVMLADVAWMSRSNPAGFVFGVLEPDGTIHEAACSALIAAANGVPCVLHRAFDRVPKPIEALDVAIQLGFSRVLSSGGESTALAGAPALARLVRHAAGRITILPCGGLRATAAPDIVRVTGCTELHGSFAEPVPPSVERGFRGYSERCQTSEAGVAACRAALATLGHAPD